MKQIISDMLESYELGKVSRRQLIQGLAVIAEPHIPLVLQRPPSRESRSTTSPFG